MHGLQLWVGLPKSEEDSRPDVRSLPGIDPADVRRWRRDVRVLAGAAYGLTSPVKTKSPLFYFDLELDARRAVELPAVLRERAVYVIEGAVTVGGERIEPKRMAVFAKDAKSILVAEAPTRFVMLGGEPLDGPRFIWWNFVSSDQDRIVDAIHAWQRRKFPKVPGDDVEFIPAPDEEPHFAAAITSRRTTSSCAIFDRREDDRDGRRVEQSRQAVAPDHEAAARRRLSRDSGEPEGDRSARSARGGLAARTSRSQSISSTCFASRRTRRRSRMTRSKIGAKTLWMQLGVRTTRPRCVRCYAASTS